MVTTIADICRTHAAGRPDAEALWFNGRSTTYAALHRLSNQAGQALIAEGLRPESRLAILDKNTDQFFEILFGAAKANMVAVPVNWRLAPPEIEYVINDARAEIVFAGPEFFPVIEKIRAGLGTVRKVVALGAAHPEWESYESWRDRHPATDPSASIGPNDVFIQLYTSGTTGHPKGAQLTNFNFLSVFGSASAEWGNWSARDVSLVAMPLFHIGGTGWATMGFFHGAKNVVLRDVVPADILALTASQRITRMFVVPAVILFLLQNPAIKETDLSSLELICYGAAPIPVDLLREALAAIPCGFAQVYGLTETTGAFTYLPPEDHHADNPRLRSCGKVMGDAIVKVVDADGKELPPFEVGEIVIKSTGVMKGYWNLPAETAKAVRGEWFHTGDAGYFDSDGYLFIHDRVKDMIISGGENIYPAEVESALFGHPAIADVAVIGVPDPKWGEAVKAVVVLKAGVSVTAEEIVAFARERIAHYKAPKSVDFAEALPRNPSGKLLKREIRKPYWAGRDRQVN